MRQLLEPDGGEVHHGDCVGADDQVGSFAAKLSGVTVTLHPPTNPSKRAFCAADEVREAKPYLDRNRDIVDETELLVAFPKGPEEKRSGTWATVRYARKLDRQIMYVWPDGTVTAKPMVQ